MNINKIICNYINKISDHGYILMMVVFSFIIDNVILIYMNISNIKFNGPKLDMSPILILILVGIVSPIFETYLYQVILIYLLKKINYLNNHKILLIIVASIIFGLSHCYSYIYIFSTFLAGLILNYSYVIYKNKTLTPFKIVLSIHSIHNIINALLMIF
ncbi:MULTISPECIES: CPBP family intramembrane glutamic endopeptidase [Thermoanaerobacterium]|uniref:Abortive infection protein n=3 Tax=Thermoanaerobacterium TaxID=28895 RepID=W9EAG1_9THEO|nr:Abortive infection protein [Thermoanaerobacterium saccharolyticum JW/SL-YS485]ETO37905.1 abortive infection protein [Thermoanaerobacterium aotearoense SCUT27]